MGQKVCFLDAFVKPLELIKMGRRSFICMLLGKFLVLSLKNAIVLIAYEYYLHLNINNSLNSPDNINNKFIRAKIVENLPETP